MTYADHKRARALIAQADASLPDRLKQIRDHAARVSLIVTPMLLACSDLLALARAEREAGVDLLPEFSALALFDLVHQLADDVDAAWDGAQRGLIALQSRRPEAMPMKRAA